MVKMSQAVQIDVVTNEQKLFAWQMVQRALHSV